MRSATREALARNRRELSSVGGGSYLTIGEQLFEAARVIGNSSQLLTSLADGAIAEDNRESLVRRVFGTLTEGTLVLLSTTVRSTWSSQDDLLAGIEEIGIRAVAESAGSDVSIENELFDFAHAVSSNSNLELAVSSKLGSSESKSALVTALLQRKASPQTLAIVDHLVQQPRGRRIGELVKSAAALVADQAGLAIATIVSAAELTSSQVKRLQDGLAKSYGRPLTLNLVIDPAIIGGLRVQVGDDIIDGSVSARINDLRLQLVG